MVGAASTGRLVLTSAGTSRMTVALLPRAVSTWLTSVSGLLAGALTSTAMLRTRPSWRPRAESTIPSTPEMPTGACAPAVSSPLVPAVTGYRLPRTSPADWPADAVVTRSPSAKSDHSCVSLAVAGGVHGRNADSAAASTVSWRPLTVIFAPSIASTERTPPSLRSRARSAAVTPPGAEAITSGTIRRGVVAPARLACDAGSLEPVPSPAAPALVLAAALAAALAVAAAGSAPADGGGPPESAATTAATAAQTATSPPPTTAGLARRLTVSSLTVRSTLQSLRPAPAEGPIIGALLAVIFSVNVSGGSRTARMGRIYRVIAGTVVATATL